MKIQVSTKVEEVAIAKKRGPTGVKGNNELEASTSSIRDIINNLFPHFPCPHV